MDKRTDRIESLLNEDLDAIVLNGKKAKRKRRLIAVASVAAISIIVVLLVNWFTMRNSKYNEAVTSLNNEEYELAAQLFDELGNYQDSAELLTEASYYLGVEKMEAGSFEEAIYNFQRAGNYSDYDGSASDLLTISSEMLEYVNSDLYIKDIPEAIQSLSRADPALENAQYSYKCDGYIYNGEWNSTLNVEFEISDVSGLNESSEEFEFNVDFVGFELRFLAYDEYGGHNFSLVRVRVYDSNDSLVCSGSYPVSYGYHMLNDNDFLNFLDRVSEKSDELFG